jgi:lipopolysaccharide export system protein LptA
MSRKILAFISALLLTGPAFSQTNISLGGFTADSAAPIEITADNLSVDQDTGVAKLSGKVFIGQGALKLTAGDVEGIYAAEEGKIAQLIVSNGVTFVTESEAAEANSAEYNIETGVLTLNGDVLLTQGPSAISAERMVLNLASGNAELTGRVKTILQQGNN